MNPWETFHWSAGLSNNRGKWIETELFMYLHIMFFKVELPTTTTCFTLFKWSACIIVTDHWLPVPTISGHYGAVQDIAWEPTGGEFLLSVSADQTTRAYAPWVHEDKAITWREVARPQIHGYNMQCVCMITPVLFVSGADEKVNTISTNDRHATWNPAPLRKTAYYTKRL